MTRGLKLFLSREIILTASRSYMTEIKNNALFFALHQQKRSVHTAPLSRIQRIKFVQTPPTKLVGHIVENKRKITKKTGCVIYYCADRFSSLMNE